MQIVCSALQIIQRQTLSRLEELWLLLTAMNELSDSLFSICAFVFPTSLASVMVSRADTENEFMLWEMVEKHHLHYVNNENYGCPCSLELMARVFENNIQAFSPWPWGKKIYMPVLCFYFKNNLFSPCPLDLRKAACNECYLNIEAISRMNIKPLPVDSWEKWHMKKIQKISG